LLNRLYARLKKNEKLFTRIHGKWYNLAKFEHPGGPVALGLSKGRDGTALFESHHYFVPRAQLLQILAKYEVSPDESKTLTTPDDKYDGQPYDWSGIEQDGFSSEIRTLVVDYFTALAKKNGTSVLEATKSTPKKWLIVCTFLTLFVASLPSFVHGNPAFLVITPVLAWLSICNYWHDAMHFALSSDWRINALSPYLLPLLSSPSMWYHQHVIGHHAYTNMAFKDPDLVHAVPLVREHESIRWRPAHAIQGRLASILFVWSVASGIGLNLLNDIGATVKMTYNNVVPCERPSALGLLAHLGGRVLYIYVSFAWPFFATELFPTWPKAIVWAMVPNAIFSICFMLNTQINHLTGECAHARDSNFFKHQMITAQNFGNGNWFCFYFSGGLNYQIEHHLFPSVNHTHLPKLSAGVKRICEKYDVPYNHASGYKEAIVQHFAHTEEMGRKPVKR